MIIIDGTCAERSLYCDHVSRATGQQVQVLDGPRDSMRWYYDHKTDISLQDQQVIIDGFHIRDCWRPGAMTSKQLNNLAYCSAGLSNSVNIYYCLTVNMYQYWIERTFFELQRRAHVHLIILSATGEAIARTYAGTPLQQDKNLVISDYYREMYDQERAELYRLYAR